MMLAGGWNRERKAAAHSGCRFDPDAAAVALDDLAADGEAKAGAAGFVAEDVTNLFELAEDPLMVLGGDPYSSVGDTQLYCVAQTLRRERDAATRCELCCVVKQI